MAQPEFRPDSILEEDECGRCSWRAHRDGNGVNAGPKVVPKAEIRLFQF